ncbi:MAG: GNAT family N-acetyltransferase, partial [Bacilli bacterium]|nr:GNAT family N-acetyltransferase [Bacilli bacterium]
MIKVTNELTEHGKQIREEVFIHEQGFTIEIDEVDNYAYHVVYYKNDVAVAVCRFFNDNNSSTYHIGRFAVKKDYRNQHIGKDMLIKVLDKIKEIG